jgi:hypothetical protein
MIYKTWCCKYKKTVKLAQDVGFKEIDDDDVDELLQSHSEPLSNEDLMATEKERAAKL